MSEPVVITLDHHVDACSKYGVVGYLYNLAAHGDGGWGTSSPGGWGKERAYRFVMGGGWAPSMVIENGKIMSGVEFVTSRTD